MNDNQTMPALIPIQLSGVYKGVVMTTPDYIKAANPASFFSPQAHVNVNLDINSTRLQSASWKNNSGTVTLSVFEGGLHFPAKCPNCMKQATKTELVEVAVPKRSLGKVEFSGKSVPASRISTAVTCDRYWYYVPFCEKCSTKKNAIGIIGKNNQIGRNDSTVVMKNREYAREFAALNATTKTKWISSRHTLLKTLGLVVSLIFGIAFLMPFVTSNGHAVVTMPPVVMALMALAVIGGFVMIFIGSKGEAL